MKRRRDWNIQLWLHISFFVFVSYVSFSLTVDELDSVIQNYAFKVQAQQKTSIVCPVHLPKDLSGVSSAVIRIRSSTLWLDGVDIGSIHIPPKTVAIPQVQRLIIVYHDLGNQSTSYQTVQNYSLATPVIGLLAYNDSDANSPAIKSIDIQVKGNPIVVKFPKVNFPKRVNLTKVKCMRFGYMGSQSFANWSATDECSVEGDGHFAIIVPSDEFMFPGPAPLPSGMEERRKREWVNWGVVFAIGVASLLALCLLGVRITKRKREEDMRRKAEDGEVLEDVWVNGSRMPSASMIRTQPALEQGTSP